MGTVINDKDYQETKNIKFCAYLSLSGIHPCEVKKIDKGRAIYVFKIPKREFEIHQIIFNQSDFLKYANAIEAIKDLAY